MFWKACVLACSVASLAGCSDLTSRVSGQVMLDGKPLEIAEGQRGTVLFRPVEGGPTTTAIIESDGTYTLKTGSASGIKPGDYLVSVRVVEIKPAGEEGAAPTGTPITPAIYADPLQSGFQFNVKSGNNRFDLELDSTAGPVYKLEAEPQGEESESATEEDAEGEAEPNEEGEPSGEEMPEEPAAKEKDVNAEPAEVEADSASDNQEPVLDSEAPNTERAEVEK